MPIIIFGTRGRTVTDSEASSTTGQCGQCGQIVPFEPVRRRRFFTLFFVPVIPLEKGQAALRCPNCGTVYKRREAGVE